MDIEKEEAKAAIELMKGRESLQAAASKSELDDAAQQTSLATKLSGEMAMGAMKLDLARQTAKVKVQQAKQKPKSKPAAK